MPPNISTVLDIEYGIEDIHEKQKSHQVCWLAEPVSA